MKKIRRWFYNQALKDADIKKEIKNHIRHESIGYNNWVSSLSKNGFPKNENGTMMNCWQLHDYYTAESNKHNVFVSHAKNYDN